MKNIILMLCIALIASCTLAKNPPDAVKKAFEQKFPKASKVEWGKENKTEWEAEFTLDGIKLSANFTSEGVWVETETEIPVEKLPVKLTAAINKQYTGWKIVGADKIESVKNGSFYEADLKTGKKKKEVELKEDGTFMKQ